MDQTSIDEKKRRIQVALWAYAYEIKDDSLVSDAQYDETCLLIDTSIKTGNKEMDKFFQRHFDPSTGMWIHRHPGIKRLAEIYESIKDCHEKEF